MRCGFHVCDSGTVASGVFHEVRFIRHEASLKGEIRYNMQDKLISHFFVKFVTQKEKNNSCSNAMKISSMRTMSKPRYLPCVIRFTTT